MVVSFTLWLFYLLVTGSFPKPSATIELNALALDIEPGSAVRVHYSFKNVYLAEIVLYNLCHYGYLHFLSLFDQTYTRQHTDPAIHVPAEEETLICERYKLSIQ